jgi:hypothetical protein
MNTAADSAAPSTRRARPKFLKKITPKTVTDEVGINLGDREWVILNVKAPVVLYDLYGTINRIKTGHTDKGDWTAFVGRFQAVTPDGREFDSGKTHIPVLEDLLYSALTSAQETDPKAAIEIALRVSVKPAPKEKPSATGYEYDVQRLIEARNESDPIARLRAEANSNLLPGPADSTSSSSPAPANGGVSAGAPAGGTPSDPPPAAGAVPAAGAAKGHQHRGR